MKQWSCWRSRKGWNYERF